MNLRKTLLFLFAFAKMADAAIGGTRGLSKIDETTWDDTLQQCHGTVCNIWGDPHVITCDGTGYDCNAYGLFTVMKNFLYNIQGYFVHVASLEMREVIGWNNFPRATYANSFVIENVQDPEVPVFQFSFPEVIDPRGPPEEHNCYSDYIMDKTLEGHKHTEVHSIAECRQVCEDTQGCFNFYFSYGWGTCHLAPKDAAVKKKPRNWKGRTVAGAVDTCGIDYSDRAGEIHEFANWYGNDIRYKEQEKCPVLFYENGELIDISRLDTPMKGDGGFLYGDADSDVYVQFHDFNKIRIVTKTDEGNLSVIMLEVAGKGLGERFGCHWNIFVCLPKDEKNDFLNSVGLLGSPNGIRSDDWMNKDGTVLPIPTSNRKGNGKKGPEAFKYCTENWCVPQKESKFIPPDGATYDDIACVEEEFIPITEDNCLVSTEVIIEHCSHHPPLLAAQCELECCLSDCDIDEQVEEIIDVKPLGADEEDNVYDTIKPEDPSICEDGGYSATSAEICPDAGDIVEVLNGDGPPPVLYGVKFLTPHDDSHGTEISFHVGNSLTDDVKTYVRYEKKVGQYAQDPACDKQVGVAPGCAETNNKITVGCVEYPGVPPFALVDIYFASSGLSGGPAVQECCGADDDGFGVVKYSLKIQCGCPATA